MSDQVTPPAETPKTLTQDQQFDATFDRMTKGEPAPASTQTPAKVEAAAAAQAKRLLKLKIDHEEREEDWDAVWTDEAKREQMRLSWQRGLNADREVQRAKEAAQKDAQEQSRKAWNEFLASHGYDVVKDASHPSGWKPVARQVTTPAPTVVSLTTEIDSLEAKIEKDALEDGAKPSDLVKLTRLRDERREARDKDAEATRSQQTARQNGEAAYVRAKAAATEEAKKFIAARTKSFEGLPNSDARIAKIVEKAVSEAERVGNSLPVATTPEAKADSWARILAAAKAVVFEEADTLDAVRAHALGTLPKPHEPPPSAPIVGAGVPASGGKPKTWDEQYDETYDRALKGVR